MSRRGRLGAYAAYQLRDFALERGLPVMLVGALLGWTTLLELGGRWGSGWRLRENAAAIAEVGLRGALVQFSFLAVLITVSGIIANDRKHGYFRLLFARPVSAVRYYLQAFVVAGVVLLLAVAALYGVWAVVAVPVPIWGALRAIAFYYVVVGSTAMLMSALVKWDWVATGVVWGASSILRALYARETGTIAWIVKHATAPTHVIDSLRDQLYRGVAPDREPLLWALLWSAACVAAALLVVRIRPMAQ